MVAASFILIDSIYQDFTDVNKNSYHLSSPSPVVQEVSIIVIFG